METIKKVWNSQSELVMRVGLMCFIMVGLPLLLKMMAEKQSLYYTLIYTSISFSVPLIVMTLVIGFLILKQSVSKLIK